MTDIKEAIIPKETVVYSTKIALPPNESSKNINFNIRRRLNRLLNRKCNEHGSYISGDIDILHRPESGGQIDYIQTFSADTIYSIYYQASSLKISEGDIIYNAKIIAVTQNEILFDVDGMIDGAIPSDNLPKNFQKIYSPEQIINVRIIKATYIQGTSKITITADICNQMHVTNAFRLRQFRPNDIGNISARIQTDSSVKMRLYNLVDGISEKLDHDYGKTIEGFETYVNSLNLLTKDKSSDDMLSMEYNEIFHTFRFIRKKISSFMISVSPNVESDTVIYKSFDDYYNIYNSLKRNNSMEIKNVSKSKAKYSEIDLYIDQNNLETFVRECIDESEFPNNAIVKIPINVTNQDLMWLYLLSGIYKTCACYIPEIVDITKIDSLYLICIGKVDNNRINYKKIQEGIAKPGYTIFKNGSASYKYLESNIILFLEKIRDIQHLFNSNLLKTVEKFDRKVPKLSHRDIISEEKNTFRDEYVEKFLTANIHQNLDDENDVMKQVGGGYSDSESYYSDSSDSSDGSGDSNRTDGFSSEGSYEYYSGSEYYSDSESDSKKSKK